MIYLDLYFILCKDLTTTYEYFQQSLTKVSEEGAARGKGNPQRRSTRQFIRIGNPRGYGIHEFDHKY